MTFVQPFSGALSALLILGVSLAIPLTLSVDLLLNWSILAAVNAMPMLLVIGLLWRGAYPSQVAALPQPYRGLAYLAISAVFGLLNTALIYFVVDGRLLPQDPYANLFVILAWIVSINFIVPMRGWPFTLMSKSSGVVAAALLVSAFALTWVLFRWMMNFAFLQGSPLYVEALDPAGWFMAWKPLVVAYMAAMILLLLILLDFTPLRFVFRCISLLEMHLWHGLTAITCSLLAALAVFAVIVGGLDVDVVVLHCAKPSVSALACLSCLCLFRLRYFSGLRSRCEEFC